MSIFYKLISFGKIKIDDQFDLQKDALKVELELDAFLNSSMYKKFVKILGWTLGSAALYLREPNWTPSKPVLKNILDYDNPFIYKRENTDSTKRTIVNVLKFIFRLLLYLYMIIFIIQLLSISYIQFKYDKISNQLKPLVRLNGTQNKKCALENDLYFKNKLDETNFELMKAYMNWLHFLGSPAPLVRNLNASTWAAIGTTIFLLTFASAMLLFTSGIRIDSIYSILNLREDRARIRRELVNIVMDLVASFERYEIYLLERAKKSPLSDENYLIPTIFEPKHKFNFGYGFNGGSKSKGRINLKYAINTSGSSLFINTLLDFKLPDIVEQASTRITWYVELTKFIFNLFFTTTIELVISFMILLSCLASAELFERSKLRLDQIECRRWNIHGVPIKSNNDLVELSSNSDIQAYLNYDGSNIAFYKLAFFIESKYYLSNAIILNIFGIITATVWGSMILGIYCGTYIHGFIEKFLWLTRIKEQIEECIRSIEVHKNITNTKTSDQGIVLSQKRVMKALVITYINFELFRRQQVHYKEYTNFFIRMWLLLMIQTIFVCYYSGATISDGYMTTLLLMETYVMGICNFYLISAAYRENHFQRLMKLVARLSTRLSEIDHDHWYIGHLWRHQILDDYDVKRHFSQTFLGVFISYNHILTINGYIGLTWLITTMAKSAHG